MRSLEEGYLNTKINNKWTFKSLSFIFVCIFVHKLIKLIRDEISLSNP